MARLLTQVLGTMSGSVGDIVFRRRGGRSYVSAHPSGYTPRTDAATVARKKQFKTAVEIAKNINSIPLLKAVWPTDATKLVSKFQKMVSVNYKLVSGEDLTGQPTLTPSLGFEMTTPIVQLTANSVHFTAGQPWKYGVARWPGRLLSNRPIPSIDPEPFRGHWSSFVD